MNAQAEKTYKSPRRKLVRFFEKSRDQWKAKCLEAKATAKALKHRIRYLEKSKAEWKTKAKELEQELARMRAQQHGAARQEEDKKTADLRPLPALSGKFRANPAVSHLFGGPYLAVYQARVIRRRELSRCQPYA
jgi:septal ring factor EnvC (AmiA/AmiB activator)